MCHPRTVCLQTGGKESGVFPPALQHRGLSRDEWPAHIPGPNLAAGPDRQTAEGQTHKADALNKREYNFQGGKKPCQSKLHSIQPLTKACFCTGQHAAEAVARRNVRRCQAELPKLNLVAPEPAPHISLTPACTVPTLSLGHRGTLPAIASKKWQSRRPGQVNTHNPNNWTNRHLVFPVKTDGWKKTGRGHVYRTDVYAPPRFSLLMTFLPPQPQDESHHAALKTCHMPPLDRKPGRYWKITNKQKTTLPTSKKKKKGKQISQNRTDLIYRALRPRCFDRPDVEV